MNISIRKQISELRVKLLGFNKKMLQEYIDKLDNIDKNIILDGNLGNGMVPNIVLCMSSERIKFFIENHGNINICFKISLMGIDNIFTPLLWEVIHNKDTDNINTLLDFGANIYERDMKNHTAFYYAKEQKKLNICDLLMKKHKKNKKKIKKIFEKTILNSDCIKLIINYLCIL